MAVKTKASRKRLPHELGPALIAPCGMNCGLCIGYLRDKNSCQGCRTGDEGKASSVLACSIRRCETLRDSESGFCVDCDRMPCPRLKRLDVRYRAKYRMSMLENLRAIGAAGIEAFVEAERARWMCPGCGGVQCVHTPECIYCGHVWDESR
jgi:hypothetical protein